MLKRSKRKGNQSGPSRQQLDKIPASSYTDSDEALEAGIQLEEKAERFAVGDKAAKYYRLALDVYRRALQLLPAQQRADAAYNAARVLLILATTFTLPPQSIGLLEEAVGLFDLARQTSTPTSSIDGSPNAFFLDVQFNMASAQVALADQLGRITPSSDRIPPTLEQALFAFRQVLDGQLSVLQQQLQQESEMQQAEVERPQLVENEEVGEEGEEGDTSSMSNDQIQTAFTVSLITPASALETVASIHSTALDLLDTCQNEEQVAHVETASHDNLNQAQDIVSLFPDGEQRSPENEWIEQTMALRLASSENAVALLAHRLTWDRLRAVAENVLQECGGLMEQAGQMVFDVTTTQGRALQRSHQGLVERAGDLVLHLARISVGHVWRLVEGDAAQRMASTQLAWLLCTQASKLLLFALKAIESQSTSGHTATVVLGASNTADNPTGRRRAALLTNLSTVSILRTDAIFQQAQGGQVDRTTMRTLLDSARIYARKALAEVGLAWILQGQRGTGMAYSAPHGGLDSMAVDCEAMLALWRALIHRMVELREDPTAQEAAKTEVVRSVAAVQDGLLHNCPEAIVSTWQACLGLTHDGQGNDGLGVWEQATGEEAPNVAEEERQAWVELEAALKLNA